MQVVLYGTKEALENNFNSKTKSKKMKGVIRWAGGRIATRGKKSILISEDEKLEIALTSMFAQSRILHNTKIRMSKAILYVQFRSS